MNRFTPLALSIALLAGCVDATAPVVDTTASVVPGEAIVARPARPQWSWEPTPYRIHLNFPYSHWPGEDVRRVVEESADAWERIVSTTFVGPSEECDTNLNGLIVDVVRIQDIKFIPSGYGVAEVSCPDPRERRRVPPRRSRVGLENTVDERPSKFVRAIALHELGHALGIGPVTEMSMWYPPSPENGGEQRYRYECEYATNSGDTLRRPPWGFRPRRFSMAADEYERLGGLTEDFVPGGSDGHTHLSLRYGDVMGVTPHTYDDPAPTSVIVALLAGIGYDVDLSVVRDTRVISNPYDSVRAKGYYDVREGENENRFCAPFASHDPEFSYWGSVRRLLHPTRGWLDFSTRLIRNW